MTEEIGHGISYHGGFQVGDEVEVRVMGVWEPSIHIIERFDGMSLFVVSKDRRHGEAVLIYDVRHPHLAKEVHKRHGGRS